MIRARHRALLAEVAAMQVGDCLQWNVPEGCSQRSLSSTVDNWRRAKRIDSVVRLHFYNHRMFIVRLA